MATRDQHLTEEKRSLSAALAAGTAGGISTAVTHKALSYLPSGKKKKGSKKK